MAVEHVSQIEELFGINGPWTEVAWMPLPNPIFPANRTEVFPIFQTDEIVYRAMVRALSFLYIKIR